MAWWTRQGAPIARRDWLGIVALGFLGYYLASLLDLFQIDGLGQLRARGRLRAAVHGVARGRRFLERAPEKFDAIIIDPPPPVQTAGSSLLYSEDFYSVAKQRLEPGGILQQWLPESDDATQAAVALALKCSFPYVLVFRGIEGWGWHFLASERPIPSRTAAELAARVPPNAVHDMLEWGPGRSSEEQFQRIVSHPLSLDALIALCPGTPALRDDRPINEYFLLRTPFDRLMAME